MEEPDDDDHVAADTRAANEHIHNNHSLIYDSDDESAHEDVAEVLVANPATGKNEIIGEDETSKHSRHKPHSNHEKNIEHDINNFGLNPVHSIDNNYDTDPPHVCSSDIDV